MQELVIMNGIWFGFFDLNVVGFAMKYSLAADIDSRVSIYRSLVLSDLISVFS